MERVMTEDRGECKWLYKNFEREKSQKKSENS